MGKFKPIIIMKRILLAICMMAMSALSYGQSNRVSFTFAWLSDVHLNSFAYAEDDLRQSIEDINANPAVDFTILSGDVTEFGDTKEFLLLQEILEGFRKPYLLLPGNHDVNWSENGCTMFNKIFQASHFCYDWQGVRFIGCGAGPSLRMGPPHIPREEILWLDSIVRATPKELPVIFVNHFPLNRDLSNWYEVTDILKTRNVLVTLAGHLHTNRAYDAEGIPAVIGRSSLRREDPIGGYTYTAYRKGSGWNSRNYHNEEYYPLRHNGGSENLWHKLNNNEYIAVSVEQKMVYTAISGWSNRKYHDNQNSLYCLVSGE